MGRSKQQRYIYSNIYKLLISNLLQTINNQMQKQKLYWKDVLEQVERAGVNQQNYLKMKQREINRQLLNDLQQDIIRHQQQTKNKSAEKIKERNIIQQQVKKEKEKKCLEKNQHLRKQLEFKGSNYELMQMSNASKLNASPVSEYPFEKMCEEQQKRRELNRQKQLNQNRVNEMQQKIKQQQKQQINRIDNLYKQKFMNHVQQFYEKKLEDRNIFKKKYLKLNNLQRSHFLGNSSLLQQQSNLSIQDQYQQTNIQQINLKRDRNQHQEELDQVIQKFNKNISIPTSSPAFLGRNPINYDRAKQLQYIGQSFRRRPMPIVQRMKTEGDEIYGHKKYNSLTESPIHDKYYDKNVKTQERITDRLPYLSIEKPMNQTNPLYTKIDNSHSVMGQRQVAKEVGTPNVQAHSSYLQRKKFLTFDIILGRKKQIYL